MSNRSEEQHDCVFIYDCVFIFDRVLLSPRFVISSAGKGYPTLAHVEDEIFTRTLEKELILTNSFLLKKKFFELT